MTVTAGSTTLRWPDPVREALSSNSPTVPTDQPDTPMAATKPCPDRLPITPCPSPGTPGDVPGQIAYAHRTRTSSPTMTPHP